MMLNLGFLRLAENYYDVSQKCIHGVIYNL
jgi:hypothetical protein